MKQSEIVPVINPENLHIVEFLERTVVAANNLWHFSALIVPFQENTDNILLQVRPTGKTYAGKLDIFGGYVRKNTLGERLHANFDKETLAELFLETAVREANEELQITQWGQRLHFPPDAFTRIGNVGQFVSDNDILREVSTVYFLPIPTNAIVKTFDDIQGEPLELRSSFWNFADMLALFQNAPHRFSDGIARILRLYQSDQSIKDIIQTIIARPS